MNPVFLLSVLLASLVGSLHCALMCGPFVAVYAGGASQAPFRLHAAYHCGRLATYLVLGALAGLLGHALDLTGSLLGVTRIAALVAGLVAATFGLLGMLRGASGASGAFAGPLARLAPRLMRLPEAPRALALGASTTLLPCGFLYAFAAVAAGTGSVLGGTLVMGVFWLGTVPALLGVGLVVGKIAERLRGHVSFTSSALLVVLGIATVIGRGNLAATAVSALHPERLGTSPSAASRTTAPLTVEPPCHAKGAR
ncbi:MAG: sulfite exporter TauE/SafE family protein [Pseudomonadota bacterium]|nr:MAG: hypothetical protein DIU78_13930 [Pseudomonadota bacterium]